MTKVSFQLIVFNDDYVLPAVLESVTPFGEVYVCEGPVKYFADKGFTTSTDKTNEILNYYVPGKNILHGVWSEKDEMCNAALSLMPNDTNFVFQVDADECWKECDLTRIFGILADGKTDSMAFRFVSFYGGFDRTMSGFEYDFENHRIQRYYRGCQWKTHRPPTILALDGKPWREHNHLSHKDTSDLGMFIYHYSYVFPNQIATKTQYYHARDSRGTIPNYLEQVYRPWILGDDRTKKQIEHKWQGVHDWIPSRRGACFTRQFEGEHPTAIARRLPELRERFARELEEFR